MNIFERASRRKLRFQSSAGELTTEQLWDLPLSATRNKTLTLDSIARATNRELKNIEEDSFVTSTPNLRKTELELMLDILKHIIDSKLKDIEQAEKAAQTAEQRHRLLAALDKKQDEEIGSMSKDEIQAKLRELENVS